MKRRESTRRPANNSMQRTALRAAADAERSAFGGYPMEILYSSHHARHATMLQLPGCPVPFFEIPARAEAIVQAIREAGLGVPGEPDDFGMTAITDVHDPDFVRYLQEAYHKTRPFFEGTNPAFADTYGCVGRRHKPTDWPGQLGYYSFDVSAAIFEGTWEAAYWSA